MLLVKKLDPRAIVPTVAHPGEDVAYDLYAIEDVVLYKGLPTLVSTGIAAEHHTVAVKSETHFLSSIGRNSRIDSPNGLLIRDRSSMAAKGITTSGGVIDAGYRGEIKVILTSGLTDLDIKAGDKIAQMIPIPVLTGIVIELVNSELSSTSREGKGFGSSGR